MVNRYRPMRQNPPSTRMCSIAAPSDPTIGKLWRGLGVVNRKSTYKVSQGRGIFEVLLRIFRPERNLCKNVPLCVRLARPIYSTELAR